MNETLKTIFHRRSIRLYKPEQIRDEDLQTILEAGKYAPSGMNEQLWHFTVIQHQEILSSINIACREVYLKSANKNFVERAKAENFSVFYDAPTLIIVSGDENSLTPQANCTLALGNMLLAADALGLGSCWINAVQYIFDSEDGQALRTKLCIPAGYKVYGSGAFGYKAAASPVPAPRKENTVTIIK